MDQIDWKWYQDRVADLFERLKGATVDRDVEEEGRDGTVRKLDVRVLVNASIDIGHGYEISVPIRIVVDAKAHKRPLDIKEIESLAGLRDDVRANLLVVVSPQGVTEGAKKRAPSLGVYPITVTADLLALAEGLPVDKFYPCLICEFNLEEDRKPPEVWWRGIEGRCDSCNGLHVQCGDCAEVFGITEVEYEKVFECPGGCGAVYFTVREGSRPKEAEWILHYWDALETSVLWAAAEKPSRSLTAEEVTKLVEATRWQHGDVDSPLIRLTEECLMEWEDDRLKLIEEGQKVVDEVIVRAESPLCY